jgi:hypothetical protein
MNVDESLKGVTDENLKRCPNVCIITYCDCPEGTCKQKEQLEASLKPKLYTQEQLDKAKKDAYNQGWNDTTNVYEGEPNIDIEDMYTFISWWRCIDKDIVRQEYLNYVNNPKP